MIDRVVELPCARQGDGEVVVDFGIVRVKLDGAFRIA